MKQQYQEEFLKVWQVSKRKPIPAKYYAWGFLIAALLLAIIGGSGCHTVKRACKTLDAHPKQKAEYCATSFKPIEKTRTIIKHTPGKPVKVPGDPIYVTVDCDSVVKASQKAQSRPKSLGPQGSNIVRVPVPTYLQVDTASIQEVIERENVAALAFKDIELSELKTKLAISDTFKVKGWNEAKRLNKVVRNRTLALIGVLLSIGAYFAIKWRIEYVRNKAKELGKYI